jgi:hypothetical protein
MITDTSGSPIEKESLPKPRVSVEMARYLSANQVRVEGIREGGHVTCHVPFSLIEGEGVAVNEAHAGDLGQQMVSTAEKRGRGSGQDNPITLGYIQGEPSLKIIDGFHRFTSLQEQQHKEIFSVVLETDWDELYDKRISTAKDHRHVRFSRVVQWMREVWGYSELAKVMTLEQAALLYRFDTNGEKLGIPDEDVSSAKTWVAQKEKNWGMSVMTIHSYLKVAEHVDPELVHSTREKTDSNSMKAPTQSMLKVFADEIPDMFEYQHIIARTAIARNLKTPEIRAVCQLARGLTVESAEDAVSKIDWSTWKPEFQESKKQSLRRAHDIRAKGALALEAASDVISQATERLALGVERNEPLDDEARAKLTEGRDRALQIGAEAVRLAKHINVVLGLEVDNEPTVEPVVSNTVAKRPKTVVGKKPTKPSTNEKRLYDFSSTPPSMLEAFDPKKATGFSQISEDSFRVGEQTMRLAKGPMTPKVKQLLASLIDMRCQDKAPMTIKELADLSALQLSMCMSALQAVRSYERELGMPGVLIEELRDGTVTTYRLNHNLALSY